LYFTKQRLMEWSIVSVGSNPDAHKRNSETLAEMRTSLAKDLAVVAKEIKANAEKSRSVQEAQVIINSNK
jgi:hypothetical protein